MLLKFQFQAHNDLSAKCLIDRVTSAGSKSKMMNSSKRVIVLAGGTGTQTSYALDPRFCSDTGGRGVQEISDST